MITRGEYRIKGGTYGVLINHNKKEVEAVLIESGQVYSAYKSIDGDEFSFKNKEAKEMWYIIKAGLSSCTSKNATAAPFVLGTVTRHNFIKTKVNYVIDRYNSELAGAEIDKGESHISLSYFDKDIIPKNIPYIRLTRVHNTIDAVDGEDAVVVRSIEEIALEKEDITWLRNKKYYIINDDEQAEKIFSYLDNYNGPIAYDTETTGLKINMFSQVNSDKQKELEKWNKEHPDDIVRADRLVGIIFCVEKDISYYFPVFNRKFKNLYDDKKSTIRRAVAERIKAKYTIGEFKDTDRFIGDYVRNTPIDEWTSDVILMERCRNILETKHIVAHNGAFEWKVDWCYEIDTNLKDDTMIMHQLMYKFRTTTSNRGEPSNLKYLAKVELGIEQWELEDFFPDYKPDKKGTVRGNNSKNNIDFSYMTYDGTRIYAPTDGDVTFQLYIKYKQDMIENHLEMEYLYSVEIIVACAIGYMEFYGHRLDEAKIEAIKQNTRAKLSLIESEIRQIVNYSSPGELENYNLAKELVKKVDEAEKNEDAEAAERLQQELNKAVDKVYEEIANNKEHELNLASPAQVCVLFYDTLGIPFNGEKRSVAKKEIKQLLKAKDEEGNNKYPVVHLYSEYKKLDTLMTKFFDNLPYFMYPGGFIFSSFGQISTATGRMSCSKPNARAIC